MTQKQLLTEFMRQAPMQPATNYWRSHEVQEVIQFGLPAGTGLDLGCGDGHLMSIILDHVGPRELVGVDLDQAETAIANERQTYKQVETASAGALPFKDSSFDFVFSNSVLEHIPDIDSVIAEVARVLRPGGTFLFTVPGPEFHDCLARGGREDREAYLRETDLRCAHLRYWSAEQWSRQLQRAGLSVVHCHSYLTMSQMRRWEAVAWYTSGLLYRAFGRKRQPIEIQRMAKVRRASVRAPWPIAAMISWLLSLGVGEASTPQGCLLISAQRCHV
jgi:ubiquinone/menaquinone biosynthesis C-methylase UbiE